MGFLSIKRSDEPRGKTSIACANGILEEKK
jgi:hypothetical protein